MSDFDWSPVAELLGVGEVAVVDWLRDGGRNRAARLRLPDQSTVVAKACVGEGEHSFVYGEDTDDNPFRRFCNESAGCEVLGRLGFGPKRLAVDARRGLLVMEDLGAGVSLADTLLGDDPRAAADALRAYVRTLARMHRASRGGRPAWDAERKALGGSGALPVFTADDWRKTVERFTGLCENLGVRIADGSAADVAGIAAALAEPGDWLSFTPSDCCPDNHFVRGDTVAFFDGEFATFRHALLDLAYATVPFPTCWCCNRLPVALVDELVALYRRENDGPDFDDQLRLCTAMWTVTTLGWAMFRDADDEDGRWGIATHRQRYRLRTENFLASGAETLLPALHATLAALLPRLPDAEPMPIYPALRG